MTLAENAVHDHDATQDERQADLPADNAHAPPPPPQEEQTIALVERSLAGEPMAFMLLVEWYTGAIYALAHRMLGNPQDAEDACQETFLRAYLHLARFDRSRRFKTWLLAIASNYCVDRLRRRHDHQLPLDAVTYPDDDATLEPEAQTLREEERRLVRQALRQLPTKYRRLALLRYWNDLSYNEIEQVTGLREAIIKSRLYRTRQMLAQTLAPDLARTRRAQMVVG